MPKGTPFYDITLDALLHNITVLQEPLSLPILVVHFHCVLPFPAEKVRKKNVGQEPPTLK